MKHIALLLVLLTAFFSVTAEEIPEYLLDLADEYEDRAKLWGINDDDFEDEKENKFFILKLCAYHDDTYENPFDLYILRVTVQLTDRKTETVVFAQTEEKKKKKKAAAVPYYEGTQFEFQIPYGEMKRPKLSAYALEFGFKKDGYFVPLAADYDDVDSADEILNGEGREVKIKLKSMEGLYAN